LRQPSPMLANQFVSPDGGNLPSALARMEGEDPFLLGDVARDLSNLVPSITDVGVEKDIPGNRYVVWAKGPSENKGRQDGPVVVDWRHERAGQDHGAVRPGGRDIG